ncbi:MAG: hypothetical protein N2C12_05460 [Planctomycetales bacterium]
MRPRRNAISRFLRFHFLLDGQCRAPKIVFQQYRPQPDIQNATAMRSTQIRYAHASTSGLTALDRITSDAGLIELVYG